MDKNCHCGYAIGHPLVPKCTCKPNEWKSLTDDERINCEIDAKGNYFELCKQIEAKLKAKNGY